MIDSDDSTTLFLGTDFYSSILTSIQQNDWTIPRKFTISNNKKGKKIDVFSKRLIFIPINQGLHWSLFVLLNLPSIREKMKGSSELVCKKNVSKNKPFFLHFDSLEGYHPSRDIKENIIKWLRIETDRRNQHFEGQAKTQRDFDLIVPKGMTTEYYSSFTLFHHDFPYIIILLLCLHSATTKGWHRLWYIYSFISHEYVS